MSEQKTCGCGKSTVGTIVPHGDGAMDSHDVHCCITRSVPAPTPQTTRCQTCGKPETEHGPWFSDCTGFVPAPSAPARAGEPTRWSVCDGDVLYERNLADPKRPWRRISRTEDVAISHNEVVQDLIEHQESAEWESVVTLASMLSGRALAPATAEPTAEAVLQAEMEFACAISAGATTDLSTAPNDHQLAWERIKTLLIPLSRGSGPVGQASEAVRRVREFVRDQRQMTTETRVVGDTLLYRHWLSDEHFADITKLCDALSGAVAASAEAKRVEITDAMVERGMKHLKLITGLAYDDTVRTQMKEFLIAAHASPESGV